MPLAYSYVRFSTPEQSKGDSKRRQDERFTKVCERHDLTPATRYFDEGKSAWKKGKQRELSQFLDLVKSGSIAKGSWLVIESLDRISRQGFRPLQRVLEALLENGVIVATTNPERVLTDKSLDDPMSIVELLFIATRAKEESDRKSERVSAAWRSKLTKSSTAVATSRGPGWLTFNAEKQVFVGIPDRVKVVKQIFKLAVEKGLGQRAIAKRLNTKGVPAFKIDDKGRTGNKWGWAYVRLILTDKRVLGEFTHKYGKVDDYYPAIIDESTFLKAQALMKQRTRFRGATTQKVANLFTGLAFDVETNTTMLHVRKRKDKPARFIPSQYELTKTTGAKSFPYELYESEFLKVIKDLKISEVGERADNSEELGTVETELAQVDLRLSDLRTALTSLQSKETPADIVAAMGELDSTQKRLAARRDELLADCQSAKPKDTLRESQSIVERLAKESGQDKIDLRLELRQALRNLIERIDCTLHKVGWYSAIESVITFKSGQKRVFLIVARRGELQGAFAKWDNSADTSTLLASLGKNATTLLRRQLKKLIAQGKVVQVGNTYELSLS